MVIINVNDLSTKSGEYVCIWIVRFVFLGPNTVPCGLHMPYNRYHFSLADDHLVVAQCVAVSINSMGNLHYSKYDGCIRHELAHYHWQMTISQCLSLLL